MQSADTTNIAAPNASTQFATNKPVLKRGSKGKDVEELQKLLTHWDVYTGPVNGTFGPQTEQGVITFQHRIFLVEDGIVGALTWEGLYTGAPVNMPVLQRGSKGQAVVTLQSILQLTRDYTGKLDGDFGSQTDKAVRAFQPRNGLTADGVVEYRAWHKLSKVPH